MSNMDRLIRAAEKAFANGGCRGRSPPPKKSLNCFLAAQTRLGKGVWPPQPPHYFFNLITSFGSRRRWGIPAPIPPLRHIFFKSTGFAYAKACYICSLHHPVRQLPDASNVLSLNDATGQHRWIGKLLLSRLAMFMRSTSAFLSE